MKREEIFAAIPALETSRLLLRKIEMADARDLYEYASDPEVTKYVSYHHTDIEESRQRIADMQNAYDRGECMLWGMEHKEDKKYIGACGFTHWNPGERIAEIAYTLSRPYWRQGFAEEAVRRVLEFGFGVMDLNRIEARCWVENERSEKLMRRCNMTFEGVLREQLYNKGVHRDVKIYSILRREYESGQIYDNPALRADKQAYAVTK